VTFQNVPTAYPFSSAEGHPRCRISSLKDIKEKTHSGNRSAQPTPEPNISLINNKGDLGAVFKELGSSDFLKSLATSVITAGLLSSLPPSIVPVGKGLSIAQKLQAGVVRSVIRSGLASKALGGGFAAGAASALVSTGAAQLGLYDGLDATQISAVNQLCRPQQLSDARGNQGISEEARRMQK